MTEDLQHLLEKIQKDGVEKAESEASRIIDDAKAKAAEMLDNAQKEASQIVEKAQKDAESFEEKGRKSLEQAARDVVISARSGIQNAVASVMSTETANAMDDATVADMLKRVIDAYCSGSTSEILVNEADVPKFQQLILEKFSENARQGITIVPEGSIEKGFKVELKDKNIEYDLTDEAISDALSGVLRPHIAEILQKSGQ